MGEVESMRDIERARAEVRRRAAVAEPPCTERQFLAEVAGQLGHWPARSPVMRAALDRAQHELLLLASDGD